MKIYVINGYPGSGKDEFVKFCQEAYPNTKNLLTSTPVKIAFELLGWKGEKTPEVRAGMARVMEITNELFDTSYKHVCGEIAKADNDTLVFIHVREPINIQRYVSSIGADTIYIMRDRHAECSNPSDREVWKYDYTYKIDNNGSLAELREKARAFVEVYVKGGKAI